MGLSQVDVWLNQAGGLFCWDINFQQRRAACLVFRQLDRSMEDFLKAGFIWVYLFLSYQNGPVPHSNSPQSFD